MSLPIYCHWSSNCCCHIWGRAKQTGFQRARICCCAAHIDGNVRHIHQLIVVQYTERTFSCHTIWQYYWRFDFSNPTDLWFHKNLVYSLNMLDFFSVEMLVNGVWAWEAAHSVHSIVEMEVEVVTHASKWDESTMYLSRICVSENTFFSDHIQMRRNIKWCFWITCDVFFWVLTFFFLLVCV